MIARRAGIHGENSAPRGISAKPLAPLKGELSRPEGP